VFAVASLTLFRRRLLAMIATPDAPPADVARLVGEVAVLIDDLPSGTVGKAELRGTVWTVRSDASAALERGRRTRVTRVEGLTLWVRPE
jgi:membrane protein implicated in regulation of membrane protease activity